MLVSETALAAALSASAVEVAVESSVESSLSDQSQSRLRSWRLRSLNKFVMDEALMVRSVVLILKM